MSITDELPTWRKTCSMCGAYYAPYCYGIELMPGSDRELDRPYTTEPDSWCSLWRREPKKRVERQAMRKEARSMSMLSSQADELREYARRADGTFPLLASALNDAADTILSLRDRAQGLQAENARLRELVARRTARRVIVSNADTDHATGHCECGACGGAIDFFDTYCRHCGTRMEGDA